MVLTHSTEPQILYNNNGRTIYLVPDPYPYIEMQIGISTFFIADAATNTVSKLKISDTRIANMQEGELYELLNNYHDIRIPKGKE
jgi:hypothetical protein